MKIIAKSILIGVCILFTTVRFANGSVAPTRNNVGQFETVYQHYFNLKDALIKTDGENSAKFAAELLIALNAIELQKLSLDAQAVFTRIKKDLAFDAEHISETKEVNHQRDHFTSLSTNMFALIKVAKAESTVYYQSCPMANKGKGGNWLSKESAIKNPYYGNKMLSCGKTIETIK